MFSKLWKIINLIKFIGWTISKVYYIKRQGNILVLKWYPINLILTDQLKKLKSGYILNLWLILENLRSI